MEHECDHLMNTKNNDMNSSHEEDELPLFLDFPSPFFDDITTIPILENNDHIYTTPRQHHLSSASPSKPALNTTTTADDDQSPSPTTEMKQRTKKRSSVGKKDRHSKINTAQGLRDRRMRLSLDIARKFFDLQDLLGFDKASNTIEWLFCKSNKAIKEVADNYFIINSQPTNQISICEEIERMDSSILTSEIKLGATSKVLDSTKPREKAQIIQNNNNNNNLSVKETRDLARARARDRTRERLMIKEQQLVNNKQHLLGEYPNNHEIYGFGLRCLASPNFNHHHNNNNNNNNNNVEEELGYTSSSYKPTQQSFSFQHSSTHHHLLQDQLQSATVNNGFNNNYSSLINDRPAAGWLNYYSNNNTFFGMAPGGGTNFITDEHYCCNYGIVPNTHLTGDLNYEQNPRTSFLLSNIMHFQSSLNQGN